MTRVVLAGIYLGVSVPVTSQVTGWWFERSQAVKRLVLGVARVQELHPGKAILLAGVDTNLFESAVIHQPFRLFGARHVYLAPGSESAIESRPEFGDISEFILPAAVARWALARDQAVVYVAGGARLRNVTSRYQELAMFVWTERNPAAWMSVIPCLRTNSARAGMNWSKAHAVGCPGAPPCAWAGRLLLASGSTWWVFARPEEATK